MTDQSELVELKYLSVAKANTHISDLIEIVDVSKRLNAQHEITGILFFEHGYFGQVLEGSREAVEETWNRINRDKRHHSIELLGVTHIQKRKFSKWSLKLFDTKEFTVEFPKFADIVARAADPTADTLIMMRSIWSKTES